MTLSKKYQVIYADPPWPENGGVMTLDRMSGKKEPNHFNTMSIKEICELPIPTLTDTNCVLFLWSTARHFPFAFEVIKAWGFNYVNIGFCWMKRNKNNMEPVLNVGVWTRQNVEICLFATKGKPYSLLKSKSINQAIYEPRGERTAKKPGVVYRRIEEMFGNVNRLELFARNTTEGWDTWGNEVENDIVL